MYAVARGLGAASGAVNCSDFWTWPPNIFNPQCYGITAAKLFGTPEQRAAAYGATSPETVYAPVQPPAPVHAPPESVWNVPPASGQQAAGTIDDVLAEQRRQTAAQFSDTINASVRSIDEAGSDENAPTLDWKFWAIIFAGVAGVTLLAKGGR